MSQLRLHSHPSTLLPSVSPLLCSLIDGWHGVGSYIVTSPPLINMFAAICLHMAESPTAMLRTVWHHMTQLWRAHSESAASCCDLLQIIFMTLLDSTTNEMRIMCEIKQSHIWSHNAVFTCQTFWMTAGRAVSTVTANMSHFKNAVHYDCCCSH